MPASRTTARGPLLVAVDGSPEARRAVSWALHEAARRRAHLVLAHAFHTDLEVLAKETLDRELAEAERVARGVDPDLSLTGRLLAGPTVPALLDAARDAALLVVGSRGLGGAQAALGSVSLHLAGHAPVPVVVVRRRAADPPPAGRVVVGVDGSPTAEHAARLAAEEAALRGAVLQVLHAWRVPPLSWVDALGPATAAHGLQEDSARRIAERVADAVGARWPGLALEVRMVHEHPVTALVAASRHADLVVVGSRGRGAFTGLLLGSVSLEVVRESWTPVLVAHGG